MTLNLKTRKRGKPLKFLRDIKRDIYPNGGTRKIFIALYDGGIYYK
jgi:hypothetical protein